MIRLTVLFAALLCAASAFAETMPPKDTVSAKNYEFALTVANTDEAVAALVTEARRHRGVVTSYSADRVEFRVPASESASIAAAIRTTGYITDENTGVADNGEQIAVLKSQIAVKREYLAKLYRLTEESDLGGTLTAEREIESAINEIDRLKTQLRTLERQGRFSTFSLSISGPAVDRRDTGHSIWGFINRLGIDYLVKGY